MLVWRIVCECFWLFHSLPEHYIPQQRLFSTHFQQSTSVELTSESLPSLWRYCLNHWPLSRPGAVVVEHFHCYCPHSK